MAAVGGGEEGTLAPTAGRWSAVGARTRSGGGEQREEEEDPYKKNRVLPPSQTLGSKIDRLLLKRRHRLLVLSFFRHEANSIPIHQTTEIHEF